MIKDFITVCLFLIPSVSFAGNTYLVMDWKNETKIILSERQCDIQGLNGAKGVITKPDNTYVMGCWKYVDGGKHIRIDWDYPDAPGDFAVLDARNFYIVQD